MNPEAEIAGYSFPFWTRLSVELAALRHEHEQQQQQRGQDSTIARAVSVSSSSTEPSAAAIAPFVPYFTSLLSCLQRALCYPDDYDGWNEEQRDEHKKYRYFAADTLVDAVVVVGVRDALRLLWSQAQPAFERYAQSQGRAWHELEASLHCFRAIGGRVPSDEADVVPQLMTAVARPAPVAVVSASAPFAVSYTALLLIGRYADWINGHLSFLPALLALIVGALNHAPLQSSAAVAFKHVCDATSRALAEDQAVAAIEARQHKEQTAASAQSSSSFLPSLLSVYLASASLPLSEQRDVIAGMMDVVSVLEEPRLSSMLRSVVQPVLQSLQAALSSASQSLAQRDASTAEVAMHMDRLGAVFQGLEPSRHDEPEQVRRALVQLAVDSSALLSSVLDLYAHDERMMEKLGRAWRRAMTKAQQQRSNPQQQRIHQHHHQQQQQQQQAHHVHTPHPFTPLVQPLLHSVTRAYLKHPQGSVKAPTL